MGRQISIIVITVAIGQGFGMLVMGQSQDATTATGVISGRVTTPNGSVPNSIVAYASSLGVAAPPRTVIVNSDGTFKFDNLENGVYRVWAVAPGFVADVPQSSDARGIYHLGESASLVLKKGGVITGMIRNSNDAPVVAVNVRAFRVRDENGKPATNVVAFNERLTDDRGVYRIYGLLPGTYVVAAGGASRFFGGLTTGYDQDVPTYAPSATRDVATELIVRSGEETNADIQYRAEPGHAISGTVVGATIPPGQFSIGASVTVIDVKTRTVLLNTLASSANNYTFVVYGMPDGEYELLAQQASQSRDNKSSDPKRVKVQQADVTGVNLTLAPLPTISGRVLLDKSFTADCVKRHATAFQETMIFARRQKTRPPGDVKGTAPAGDQGPLLLVDQSVDAVPDAKGEFVLRNLRAGTYQTTVSLPSTAWYLSSITLSPNQRTPDSRIVRDGVTLNAQSVSGLVFTISEGAGRVRGNVTTGEGHRPTNRPMVYVVPAEKDATDNLLRYFEARSDADASFDIRNVPPGDYLILAMPGDDDRASGVLVRQDSSLRADVVRAAERLKQKLTLKPCERVDGFELPYHVGSKP